ncbi:hypothetical protein NQ314_019861, partial [Rhamnusium bicolor]
SHNDEDMSDGEGHSADENDDQDSCDDLRRHGLLADHGDVLAKLKMQVRDIKVYGTIYAPVKYSQPYLQVIIKFAIFYDLDHRVIKLGIMMVVVKVYKFSCYTLMTSTTPKPQLSSKQQRLICTRWVSAPCTISIPSSGGGFFYHRWHHNRQHLLQEVRTLQKVAPHLNTPGHSKNNSNRCVR